MENRYLGNLFIVAAPSGGGKTSLVKKLIETMPDIVVSISHTTRDKRAGEVDGEHYFFVDNPKFQQMINAGDFIEHATVFNYYYGTSKSQIEARLKAGIDVVLDIDWQGAQQIKEIFPNAVSIFVIPPSLEVLQERLQNRKRDDESIIKHRMQQAQHELSHYMEFDYLIVNDTFEKAAQELISIVQAQRLTIGRQVGQQRKLLSFLLATQ